MQSEKPFLVVIGASAGGVEAVSDLLSYLPPNIRASILCVIHRGPQLPNYLRTTLANAAHIPVEIPHDGEALRTATCYVGLPALHLTVGPGLTARLVPDGFYRGHNVDALVHSAARQGGPRVIGVVLSGLGKDGAEGLSSIKDMGGVAMVQSLADAGYDSMPRSAIAQDGAIDVIGTTKELAEAICRIVEKEHAEMSL
jgi:chemotaxis response regulator CheB